MSHNNNSIASNNTTGNNLIVYICIHLVMPWAVAIGIIGNLLSILVFARREMIKFCVSIFTIVLAVSDILLLITSLFNIILPDYLGKSLSDESAFWWYVIKSLKLCFFDKNLNFVTEGDVLFAILRRSYFNYQRLSMLLKSG